MEQIPTTFRVDLQRVTKVKGRLPMKNSTHACINHTLFTLFSHLCIKWSNIVIGKTSKTCIKGFVWFSLYVCLHQIKRQNVTDHCITYLFFPLVLFVYKILKFPLQATFSLSAQRWSIGTFFFRLFPTSAMEEKAATC